nr:MAG TPA: hypothetical protein [Caudoviricetes sp.]
MRKRKGNDFRVVSAYCVAYSVPGFVACRWISTSIYPFPRRASLELTKPYPVSPYRSSIIGLAKSADRPRFLT